MDNANTTSIANELGASTTRGIDVFEDGGVWMVFWESDLLASADTRQNALNEALVAAIDMNAFAEGYAR